MTRHQGFSTVWRGAAALALVLSAALPSARADLLQSTASQNAQVSILVDFFTVPDGIGAPLILNNQGGTVNLSLPDSASGEYGILFGMKVGANSLDFNSIFNNPNLIPPDPTTGAFSYTPTIGGQTYTISGNLVTSSPIDQNSWSPSVIPDLFGFPQVALITFSTVGDPLLNFSVDDSNGNVIQFNDTDNPRESPEPASLALAGFGVAGLAGYGLRRRRKAA